MHRRQRRLNRAATAFLAAGLGSVTVACSASPPPSAEARSPGPGCAALLAGLPSTVLAQERVAVPDGDRARADAAWGAPPVLLACGGPPLGPTTDQCVTVDGVDWVFTEPRGDGPFRFRSYGTDPAVEVGVPQSAGRENATGALVDLGPAVARLPRSGRACVG